MRELGSRAPKARVGGKEGDSTGELECRLGRYRRGEYCGHYGWCCRGVVDARRDLRKDETCAARAKLTLVYLCQ